MKRGYRPAGYFLRRILWIILGAAAVAFLVKVQSLPRDVLQMDFTAFYTAGESLNAGLSPYINHIDNIPPIWDGIDPFVFSRFQYPPPAAIFFQSLALLPFLTAKYAWVILSLLGAVMAVILTGRRFPLGAIWQWLAIGILLCAFFPLLTLVERGQIDAITLLLLTAAIYWLVKNEPRASWLAGVAIALAVLLKVYCIFLLPFLLLKKRWAALAGVACGLAALVAASFIYPGGSSLWQEYVQDVLPRIAYHNEALVQERVDPALILQIKGDVAQDATVKDGRVYRLYGFNFSSNASLVRVLLDEFFEENAAASRSLLSLLAFGVLTLPLLPWLLRSHNGRLNDGQQEFLFWQLVLVIILLAAPLTWTMNVVWLLPMSVIVLSKWRDFGKVRLAIPLALVALGLALAALPDHKTLEFVGYFEKTWLNHKYVLSEVLVLVGGVIYLYSSRQQRDGASS